MTQSIELMPRADLVGVLASKFDAVRFDGELKRNKSGAKRKAKRKKSEEKRSESEQRSEQRSVAQ